MEVEEEAWLQAASKSSMFFSPSANERAVSKTFLSKCSYCFINPVSAVSLATSAPFKLNSCFLNKPISLDILPIFLN
ncbi:hypothetical protein AALB16_16545 [Lachnospiraceae bacterium 62-35]